MVMHFDFNEITFFFTIHTQIRSVQTMNEPHSRMRWRPTEIHSGFGDMNSASAILAPPKTDFVWCSLNPISFSSSISYRLVCEKWLNSHAAPHSLHFSTEKKKMKSEKQKVRMKTTEKRKCFGGTFMRSFLLRSFSVASATHTRVCAVVLLPCLVASAGCRAPVYNTLNNVCFGFHLSFGNASCIAYLCVIICSLVGLRSPVSPYSAATSAPPKKQPDEIYGISI